MRAVACQVPTSAHADTYVRCKGEACFVGVSGSFDQSGATARCSELSAGATLAYITSVEERWLADTAARLAGSGSAWVGATAIAASSNRTSFSWTDVSDTAYIALESSWNANEPNSGGQCASVNGKLEDQACSATLTAAVCRLSASKSVRQVVHAVVDLDRRSPISRPSS